MGCNCGMCAVSWEKRINDCVFTSGRFEMEVSGGVHVKETVEAERSDRRE